MQFESVKDAVMQFESTNFLFLSQNIFWDICLVLVMCHLLLYFDIKC